MENQEREKPTFADKWSKAIERHKGFTEIPNSLMLLLEDLNITNPEFIVLIGLLSFRWDTRMPYPGMKAIGARVNRSEKTARNCLISIEAKKLIRIIPRSGTSNEYDITPLIIILERAAENDRTGRNLPPSPDDTYLSPLSKPTVKEDSIEKDANNNVVKAATTNSVHDNVKVDEVIAYWTKVTELPINTRVTANRRATLYLLKTYNADSLRQLIDASALALNDKYAPMIGDLCQLKDKANQLIAWVRKQQSSSNVEIIS